MILKFRISHTFHEISHILLQDLSCSFLSWQTRASFLLCPTVLQPTTNRHLYARKHSRALYQAILPALSIAHPNRCTPVNSSVYSSERFYPLEWNEWNVAFIIWKERQSRIRLQSIHLWNSTANDTNGHKKRANHSAPP